MMGHAVEAFGYSASRIAAGIVGATLTGFLCGIAVVVENSAVDRHFELSIALGAVFYATVFGLVLGSPLGVAVMVMSRARHAPWRSIPALLIGTTLAAIFALNAGMGENEIGFLCIALFATAGGIFATVFLPKHGASVRSLPH